MNKKLTRLTALLLAMLMMMSTLSTALADTALTVDQYTQSLQQMQDDLSLIPTQLETPNVYTTTVNTTTLVPTYSAEEGVVTPVQSITVTAQTAPEDVGGYQWMIYVEGVWANIQGETAQTLELTYAMAKPAMDENGNVQLRCKLFPAVSTFALTETEEYYEDEITAAVDDSVTYTEQPDTDEITVTQYMENEPTGEDSAYALANALQTAAETDGAEELNEYSLVINYVREGVSVAPSITYELSENESLSVTIPNPTIQGFVPTQETSADWDAAIADNILAFDAVNGITITDFPSSKKNYTVNVVYVPGPTTYLVKYELQNVEDDDYTVDTSETIDATTHDYVPDITTEYEGFYMLPHEKPQIAADGSTTVTVRYNRRYYLMNFDMVGGYGVEPIYARYGSTIGDGNGDVGTPIKEGYTFLGWSLDGTTVVELPETMPAENTTYKAVWRENDTAKVSVVIWGENASDDDYTYIETTEIYAKTGSTITFGTNQLVCALEGHQHDDECGYNCGQEAHTHNADCMSCGQEEHTHLRSCVTLSGVNNVTLSPDAETSGTWLNRLADATPSTNGVYTVESRNGDERRYIKIGAYYYQVTGNWNTNYNNIVVNYTCGKSEHAHSDTCETDCGKTVHTHSATCGYACGKTEHVHSDSCYLNGSSLDTDLWTYVRSDTVTVAADGSTVMNVYYDRVKFTLTFIDGNQTVYTLTEKWGADITSHWPIKGTNGTTYDNGERWDPSGSDEFNEVLVFLEIMPAESFTLTVSRVNYEDYYMHYMVEALPGETGTTSYTYQGETKYFKESFEVYANYNFVTKAEDFFDLEGFTQWTSNPTFGSNGRITLNNGGNVYFYYTRNKYGIVFYNPTELMEPNRTDVSYEEVPYEANLGAYDWTPDAETYAPTKYPPDSVEFAGWYLSPDCTGEEYVMADHTMPLGVNDGDVALSLYAKWVPVLKTVNFYLDETEMLNGNMIDSQSVYYGEMLETVPTVTNPPYTFVAWFYKDEAGWEHAIDFESMPVLRNLDVYGKWTSETLEEYTIYYKIATDWDDNGEPIAGIEIADATTGSTLAGESKTFKAKTGADLYEGYQIGYFPTVASHNMEIDINADNTYTFWYEEKAAVPYVVRYLDAETKDEVAATKVVANNRNAGVSETFVPVIGKMPDEYQKDLILNPNAADEGEWLTYEVANEDGTTTTVQVHPDNVITFYYSEDTENSYYRVTHYIQNLELNNYDVYDDGYESRPIGATVTESELTIRGFTYYADHPDTKTSGTVTAAAGGILELKLYYTRNLYPYTVRYRDVDTGLSVAAEKVVENIPYGKTVNENAIDVYGYSKVDPTAKSLTIDIEGNVIVFYYKEDEVTINYEVVGPTDDCGTVNPESETVKVINGIASGSVADANDPTYKFVGWYLDEKCENPVPSEWLSADGTEIIPQKQDDDNNANTPAVYVEDTYYAKFDYNLTELTVAKAFDDKNGALHDEDATFLFEVKHGNTLIARFMLNAGESVTIKGLTVGQTYTVTEISSWSERYTASYSDNTNNGAITLQPNGNTVTVTNARSENDKWLDSEAYSENQVGKQSTTN